MEKPDETAVNEQACFFKLPENKSYSINPLSLLDSQKFSQKK